MNINKVFRYAPGITGDLHIGNFKVLLFNVLAHQKYKDSKFIIRYDDTDIIRNSVDSLQNITFILNLFRITCSKIVFQSEHTQYMKLYIKKLQESGYTYYCNCESNDNCNCYDKDYLEGKLMLNIDKVLDKPELEIQDTLNGKIKFNRADMYHLALTRSNGTPLYNFVTVISDVVDGITDIIRGNDHIINTWKQVVIYKALKLITPTYTHISLILDENKNKISKSKKNSISILTMLKTGYTVQAITTYMHMLISGATNTEELIARKDELINSKSAVNLCFNIKKLKSVNKDYMKNQEFLIHDLQMFCLLNKLAFPTSIYLEEIINHIKFRHNTIEDLYNELILFNHEFKPIYSNEYTLDGLECQAIRKMENVEDIFAFKDPSIRYMLLGKHTGISVDILKKFISKSSIKYRIDYLLSLSIF